MMKAKLRKMIKRTAAAAIAGIIILGASAPTVISAEEKFTINSRTVTRLSPSEDTYYNCSDYADDLLAKIYPNYYSQTNKYSFTTFNNNKNILKGKSASERSMTKNHVKSFIRSVQAGSRIRICNSSNTTDNNYDNSRYGHTIVLVSKNDAEGTFKTLEAGSGTPYVGSYTYKSFADQWNSFRKSGMTGGYGYFFYVDDLGYLNTNVSKSRSTLTIKVGTKDYPSTIKKGQSFSIGGKISSNYTITRVTAWIIREGGAIEQKTVSTPHTTTYKLRDSKIDYNLVFGRLNKGTYYIRYNAVDESKKSVDFRTNKFKVK